MENLQDCPICKSKHIIDYQGVTDYFGTQEEFKIVQCGVCNFLFTNPRPDSGEIIKYYKSGSYVSHGDKSKGIQDYIYRQIQALNFKYKYKLIRSFTDVREPSLLDFGCGSGNWLRYMHQKDWKGVGIEPDAIARHRAEQQGLEIYSTVDTLPVNAIFQVITAFHVIEHVHELHKTLHQLYELLETNGVIIIALPNPGSYDAQKYGKYWAGLDVPRHLYHFTKNDVNNLADTIGLKVVDQYPMYWDSLYVSMLSEKYKRNKFPMFRGLYQGLKSNFVAYQNGNFSSIIYVLRKA